MGVLVVLVTLWFRVGVYSGKVCCSCWLFVCLFVFAVFAWVIVLYYLVCV